MLVYHIELPFLSLHFLLNVFRRKYWLQIHPTPLSFDPVFKGILNEDNSSLNLIGFGENGLDEGARFHHQEGVKVIIEDLLRFIHVLENVGVCLWIWLTLDFQLFQFFNYTIELFLKTILLVCFLADFLNLFSVLVESLF